MTFEFELKTGTAKEVMKIEGYECREKEKPAQSGLS